MLNRLVLFLLVLLSCTSPALAAEKSPVSFTPYIGGYIFDGAQDLDQSAVMGLRLGYAVDKNWGVEGLLEFIPTEEEQSGDLVERTRYGLDGYYDFLLGDKLTPFVAAGLSGLKSPDDTDAVFSWGGGLKYSILDEAAALRVDLRHLVMLDSDHYSNFESTFGLQIPFCGGKPVSSPVDSDKDGVIDSLDRCPHTPEGEKVDAKGCPFADSDKDGVADSQDLCPNTRSGETVDKNGCPPQTEEPYTVNLNINFESGKSDIDESYYNDLKRVGEFMKAYPDTTMTVEGHTDNQGSDEYNLDLSQERSERVRQYLIDKFGIAGSRIKANGFGPSLPIADNNTPEGRKLNRRIDAVFETPGKK